MSDLPDADLDVLSSNLSSGKLDPKTLSPEKRANLKAQLTAYQTRKSSGAPGAGANMTDASKPNYKGPPNEPGLIDQGPPGLAPILAASGSVNEALKSGGQKLENVNGPKAIAAYPAGMAMKAAGNVLPENFGQAAALATMEGPVGEGLIAAGKAAGQPILNKIVKPVSREFGNIMAEVVGQLSGKDPESVKALFSNPKAMWQKATELFSREHQKRVINTLEKDFAERGDQFHAAEEAIAGNYGTPSYGKAPDVLVRPAFDDVTYQMGKEGFRLPKGLVDGYPEVKVPKIPEDAPEYKFLVETIKGLRDNPRLKFGDALRLKQNLDKAIDYGLEGASGIQPVSEDASRLLSRIRGKINSGMQSSLSTEDRVLWNKANQEYAAAASSRAELRKQVLGQNARLTERKLHQLLKEGRYDDEVMDRAEKLGSKSRAVMQDVRDHVAARQFKDRVSGGAFHAAFVPTSPKVLGYATSGAGAGADAIKALVNGARNQPLVVQALVSHAMARDKKEEDRKK